MDLRPSVPVPSRRSRFLRRAGRLIRAALWVWTAALLLWNLLRFYPGDTWAVVRLGHYFAPWLFLLSAGALAVGAITRHPWLVGALGTVLLLFSVHYAPLFLPRHPLPAGPGALELRVMTFNVHLANRDGAGIAGLIRAEDPDLVALQEVHPELYPRLRSALGTDYPYADVANADDLPLVLLSRYPLTALDTPAMAWRSQRALLALPGGEVTVWNLHPVSPLSGENWAMHLRTTNAMAEAIAQEGGPLIVLGDLNTTDTTQVYRRLAGRLTDAHRAVGRGFGFTFPDGRRLDPPWDRLPPLLRVDCVLVSEPLIARQIHVAAEACGSDHRPVIAEIALGFRSSFHARRAPPRMKTAL